MKFEPCLDNGNNPLQGLVTIVISGVMADFCGFSTNEAVTEKSLNNPPYFLAKTCLTRR